MSYVLAKTQIFPEHSANFHEVPIKWEQRDLWGHVLGSRTAAPVWGGTDR